MECKETCASCNWGVCILILKELHLVFEQIALIAYSIPEVDLVSKSVGPPLENSEWRIVKSQLLTDFQFFICQHKWWNCVAGHAAKVKDQSNLQLTQ